MMLPLEATRWGRACEVRWTYALKLTSTILSVMVRFWGLPSHIPRGIGRMWFRIRMSIPPILLTASWNKGQKVKVKLKLGQSQISMYYFISRVRNMNNSSLQTWGLFHLENVEVIVLKVIIRIMIKVIIQLTQYSVLNFSCFTRGLNCLTLLLWVLQFISICATNIHLSIRSTACSSAIQSAES